jgi:hypothetical protein
MKKLLLLFKKDAIDKKLAFRRDKQNRDIIGHISSLILLTIIYGVFVYVFRAFAAMYLNTTFTDPTAGRDRVYELITFVYCIVFAINVCVGVKKIYGSISESKDCDVLMCQPISARTIFMYKLINIYRTQLMSSFLSLLPVTIIADVLSPFVGGAGYYFAMLFTILLVPFISCALASLLSIPYTAVMRYIDSKFVLHLVLYIVSIGVCYWIYSIFLKTLTQLLRSGEIDFVFDRNRINALHAVADKLFPSNYFANILFGTNVWISVFIILGLSMGAFIITYFVIQNMYNKILQLKMEGTVKVYNHKPVYKKRSITATLLHKEFLIVLRTPSYAFQYFATSITLPFMVYICVNLMRSMMSTLTVIDCDYELSVFVISMFCILTNTFCTTNISRDGKMFSMMKTMPVRCNDVVKCKLIFCNIVSMVSVLISSVTLAVANYLNAWQTIFVLVMSMLLSFAEIAYATRKDLNSPNFLTSDKDEVTEGNSNVSTVVLSGLFVSILAGGGSLALSTVLGLVSSITTALWASIGLVTGLIILAFALSLIFLLKGLEKNITTTRNKEAML